MLYLSFSSLLLSVPFFSLLWYIYIYMLVGGLSWSQIQAHTQDSVAGFDRATIFSRSINWEMHLERCLLTLDTSSQVIHF